MTDELLRLADWLRSGQVSEVGMEKHRSVLETGVQHSGARLK